MSMADIFRTRAAMIQPGWPGALAQGLDAGLARALEMARQNRLDALEKQRMDLLNSLTGQQMEQAKAEEERRTKAWDQGQAARAETAYGMRGMGMMPGGPSLPVPSAGDPFTGPVGMAPTGRPLQTPEGLMALFQRKEAMDAAKAAAEERAQRMKESESLIRARNAETRQKGILGSLGRGIESVGKGLGAGFRAQLGAKPVDPLDWQKKRVDLLRSLEELKKLRTAPKADPMAVMERAGKVMNYFGENPGPYWIESEGKWMSGDGHALDPNGNKATKMSFSHMMAILPGILKGMEGASGAPAEAQRPEEGSELEGLSQEQIDAIIGEIDREVNMLEKAGTRGGR